MVLYFSGTGNSRFVARAIAKETGDELICLNDRIKRGDISPSAIRSFIRICNAYVRMAYAPKSFMMPYFIQNLKAVMLLILF